MGIFADTPYTTYLKYLEQREKTKGFHPALMGQNPNLLPTFGKALWSAIDDIEIYSDECNILITSSLGNYWHRNPYCKPPPPPPPPDDEDYEKYTPIPSGFGIYFLYETNLETKERLTYFGKVGTYSSTARTNITDVEYPYEGDILINSYLNDRIKVKPRWKLTFDVYGSTSMNSIYYNARRYNPVDDNVDSNSLNSSFSGSFECYGDSDTPIITVNGEGYIFPFTIYQEERNIKAQFERERSANLPIEYTHFNVPGNGHKEYRVTRTSPDGSSQTFARKPRIYGTPILPPPPPPKPPKMECCPGQKNNDALLKLILKRIGEPKQVEIFDEDLARAGAQKSNKTPQSLNDFFKLAVERIEIANRIIGIENFPIQVPDTMIEPYKEGPFAKIFKFIDGEKKIKITTIAEFIVWMSKQDSAVLGEFHQVIEMETEVKGKNSTIVLPNVAESLKEIVLLSAQMAKQNNIQTELIFKIAAELVATRAVATKGTSISQDIQDYLDYPTDTKKAKIKTAVSLPKFTTNKDGIPVATSESENPKAFLKAGEIEYTYEDWTGRNSLHDQLLDLMQLATMLRAIYFQRTDQG